MTLTTDRLQDAVDDAVRRGRMTRKDAEELLATLLAAGRAQTEALLADLETGARRRSAVRRVAGARAGRSTARGGGGVGVGARRSRSPATTT